MAAVTICSDFGAQKDEVWHCFHCFPIYLAWCDGVRCHGLRFLNVVVVQLLSHIWLFVTPWTATRQAFLSFTISKSLLKFISIESVMPSNYLILSPPSPPVSIFPSIRVFSNESALRVRWPKYWSFTISPSNEYSELISFRLKLK